MHPPGRELVGDVSVLLASVDGSVLVTQLEPLSSQSVEDKIVAHGRVFVSEDQVTVSRTRHITNEDHFHGKNEAVRTPLVLV